MPFCASCSAVESSMKCRKLLTSFFSFHFTSQHHIFDSLKFMKPPEELISCVAEITLNVRCEKKNNLF